MDDWVAREASGEQYKRVWAEAAGDEARSESDSEERQELADSGFRFRSRVCSKGRCESTYGIADSWRSGREGIARED